MMMFRYQLGMEGLTNCDSAKLFRFVEAWQFLELL